LATKEIKPTSLYYHQQQIINAKDKVGKAVIATNSFINNNNNNRVKTQSQCQKPFLNKLKTQIVNKNVKKLKINENKSQIFDDFIDAKINNYLNSDDYIEELCKQKGITNLF
jgi:hypothetical protein